MICVKKKKKNKIVNWIQVIEKLYKFISGDQFKEIKYFSFKLLQNYIQKQFIYICCDNQRSLKSTQVNQCVLYINTISHPSLCWQESVDHIKGPRRLVVRQDVASSSDDDLDGLRRLFKMSAHLYVAFVASVLHICSPGKTLRLVLHNLPPRCRRAGASSGTGERFYTRRLRSSWQSVETSRSEELLQSHPADHCRLGPVQMFHICFCIFLLKILFEKLQNSFEWNLCCVLPYSCPSESPTMVWCSSWHPALGASPPRSRHGRSGYPHGWLSAHQAKSQTGRNTPGLQVPMEKKPWRMQWCMKALKSFQKPDSSSDFRLPDMSCSYNSWCSL